VAIPVTANIPAELLTVAEMYAADKAAIASGATGEALMEAAGASVVTAIQERWPVDSKANQRAVILCGPGNNGGDGFVVARLLAEAGWQVDLGLLGEVDNLKGEAALMAASWSGSVESLSPQLITPDTDLIVDAIFGAGLSGDIEGVVRETLKAVAACPAPCVAIDVPSGVNGDSGKTRGYVASATLTVTFFRAKPGHFLLPGRALRGELVVTDIGIPDRVLSRIAPKAMHNGPDIWIEAFPLPGTATHKYMRGHVVVDSGGVSTTGAARLAAMAALRVGAGLVTVSCPKSALLIHAAHLTSIMLQSCETLEDFGKFLPERKHNVAILGPGNGRNERTQLRTLAALQSDLGCVLDADALSCFEEDPDRLFDAIDGPCILTPHDGEFARLFGEEIADTPDGKAARTLLAAERAGAVVILKGVDTVIAAPDGRVAINTNAPAWLATAGSGDVLAGLAGGLMAQGMTAFDAACAAVWLHGACAATFGPGLIAEDLPGLIPAELRSMLQPD
jgi:ADP-dependent NAD(P)H-hydrate dehydratase / NAD(P)H-hydrate epimerase